MHIYKLSKTYKLKGEAVHALKGVTFDLPDNGMVFVLGKSGCGKSTLLNVLSGLDSFDSGDIIFEGKSLKSLSPSELDDYRNSYCGFVFQEYNLIPELNVYDNIALALELRGEKDIQAKVSEALNKVELKGYEKRKVTELSGGQKQRIAIARSIIKDPKIIFADEPSGALDSETGDSIFELLKKLSEDKLVIVVSHDRESASKYGDRIIELSGGTVIGDSDSDYKEKNKTQYSTPKSHKLSFATALKIGCSNYKFHPFRLIATVLLAIFSFTLFGISLAYASFDGVNSLTEATYDSDAEYLTIAKYRSSLHEGLMGITDLITKTFTNDIADFDSSDIDFLQSFTSEKLMYVSMVSNSILSAKNMATSIPQNELNNILENAKEHISSIGSGYVSISEEECKKLGFEIIGRLPSADNEIAISECAFNRFKLLGYMDKYGNKYTVNKPEDLLGREIIATSIIDNMIRLSYIKSIYTITGIVMTGCDNECSKNNHPFVQKYTPTGQVIPLSMHDYPEFFQADKKFLFHEKIFVNNNFIISLMKNADDTATDEEKLYTYILLPLPKNKKEFIDLTRYIVDNNGYNSEKEYYEIKNSFGEYYFRVLQLSRPFSMVFMTLGLVFFIFSVILLLNFITTSIRGQMKQIGIISALGGNFKNIYMIYALSSLIVCSIVLAFSTTAVGIIIGLLNASGKALLWINVSGTPFAILRLNFTTLISMLVIAIATALIGTLISLRKMRKLTSADIIRKGQIK